MNIRMLQSLLDRNSIQNLYQTKSLGTNGSFNRLFSHRLKQINISTSDHPMTIRERLNGSPSLLENTSSITTPIEASLSQDLNTIIKQASSQYQLDEKLIRSVIQAESSYNQYAVSHAGAEGYMQLMPATARGLGVTDSFDAKQNIFGGAKYIRQMLDRYDGDLRLALAAYNAGPGNVDKYNGIPPFHETESYVLKVLDGYKI